MFTETKEDQCWLVVKILEKTKDGRKFAKSLIEVIFETENHEDIGFDKTSNNLVSMFYWGGTHQGHGYWSKASKIFCDNRKIKEVQSCISHRIDVV